MLHRNSQKRFYLPNQIYAITTVTYNRFPYFQNNILCQLFIDELTLCKYTKQFKLFAFCVLYDHVHLLIQPEGEWNISHFMKSLKKQFSHNANRVMGYQKTFNLNVREGDKTFCRLQSPKPRLQSPKSRLQQQYHNPQYIKHNNSINNYTSKFSTSKPKIFKPFKWQRSFHDHIIRNQKDLYNQYQYITSNYKKHNYPHNHKFTSLNYQGIVDEIHNKI